MRCAVVLLLAAGCSQIFGLEHPVSGDADVMDGAAIDGRDAQGGTCVDRWRAGPAFGPVAGLGNVNTPTQERAPFVTSDGQKLYYSHDGDIFVATLVGGGFGNGLRDVDLSSGNNDGKVFVAANGLRAFLASNRNGGTGGATDLWRAVRTDMAAPWQLDQMYLQAVNEAGDQANPHLSDDLLRLYFDSKTDGVALSERQSTDDAFGVPARITSLGVTLDDGMPTLTSDEMVIVFESRRSGNIELWYATRDALGADFSAPMLVPSVNDPQRDDETPHVSPDGCQLYWASNRAGSDDIYVAALLD